MYILKFHFYVLLTLITLVYSNQLNVSSCILTHPYYVNA